MSNRLRLAISKFFFCYRISSNVFTFLKLLWNTKRFSIILNHSYSATELPSLYDLRLNNVRQRVYLRTYAGDLAILYEIFWYKVYQKFSINYKVLETIVDVGANIGLASLFFHSVSPQAKIFAIEPECSNFDVLQRNLMNAVNSENIDSYKCAINSIDGSLSLRKERFAYNTKVGNSCQGNNIEGISLNTLFKRLGITKIDLLKIDVEGFEHEIFRTNLYWLNSVDNIIIEIHSLKDYKVCIDTLLQYGFIIQPLEQKNIDQENIYWAYRDVRT